MTRTLGSLQWSAESPSFFKLVGHDIRLVFDGAIWWLYSINRSQSSASFETRQKAIDWVELELSKLTQALSRT